jgi:endo-alpha-1,4-polygalactosaminidase (GH114 family)/predicted cobalt transporter CbtA
MSDYVFPAARTAYRLEIAAGGTLVIGDGVSTLVPFGVAMSFADRVKISKDTISMVHNITSHLEAYTPWETTVDLPVNFLRTSVYWTAGPGTILPDRADKVIVAYVNSSEFGAVGGWDPSFKAAWDLNGDYRIDAGISGLPGYVDTRVFNADWNNYVAKYWDPSWLEEQKKKIDLVASQHFDGVMLDVMTPYWTWLNANLGYDKNFLRAEVAKLFRSISDYAKSKYGESFIVSANLDPDAHEYFQDLAKYIDVGYYQNAFLSWDGSGVTNPYGPGSRAIAGDTRALDFLVDNGVSVLTMDHLGTGPRPGPGYEHFIDYDDRITPARTLDFLFQAQKAGVLPYLSPLLFGEPFALVPRYATVDVNGVHEGTSHKDYVIGSEGADRIYGAAGDDAFVAGSGDDLVFGGTGADLLFGQDGNDVLDAGDGLDRLTGGEGADTLSGGSGVDLLEGGSGRDTFIDTAAGLTGDTITDFSPRDRIVISDASLANFTFNLTGSTLTYTGGSLSFGSPVSGAFVASALATGGVQLTLLTNQFTSSTGVLVSNFALGAGGWSSQNLYPRHIADVNGDGFSDIVGFGQAGVLVSLGSPSGTFSGPGLAIGNFGQASGWSSDNQFHRELADVNGDGRADIVGFGIAGTLVSLARADGSFSSPVTGISNFGANQGWATQDGFARTTGDVNGDGKADLIGFGYAGTLVSLGNGDGTFQAVKVAIANFGVEQGWTSDNSFHRLVADVNGDGRDDLVGFGYAGVLVALAKGDGTFDAPKLALANFGKEQGWSSQDSFARDAADVNGDGIADIVGFGIAGTFVAYGQANGSFAPARFDMQNFGANQGWTSDNIYHRELADINNDGEIDIIGFGHAGVLAGYNQGYWLA